jgi:uncharacterized protein with GYD domain
VPKYLIQGSYKVDGVKGLLQAGGTSRRDAVARLAESLGGRLESFYFGFGDHDAYVIVDLPDNASMAAASLTAAASGTVRVSTVVLMTPEEIDEAARKSPDYRPPGS